MKFFPQQIDRILKQLSVVKPYFIRKYAITYL